MISLTAARFALPLAFAVIAASIANATDRTWIGPDGGIYVDPKNWTPGGAPFGNDEAFFDSAGGGVVFFTDPSHLRLIMRAGVWTFDLNGHTHSLTAAPPGSGVIVADQPGSSAFLSITDGAISCHNGAVATAGTSTGQVLVMNGGVWSIGQLLDVGSGGNGHLDVMVGGTVSADEIRFAVFPGSTGQSFVEDPGSTLEAFTSLTLGVAGDASVIVNNGGTLLAGDTVLGVGTGVLGDLFVAGSGTTWQTTGDLDIGGSGEGELSILGAAAPTVTGHVTIARDASSLGYVEVLGTTTTWSVGDTLTVAGLGGGELLIENAQVDATFLAVGDAAGSDGIVTVDGPTASLSTLSTLRVGVDGAGTLKLQDGATATSTQLATIGDGPAGSGTVVIDDSTWTNLPGQIAIGDLGTGAMTVRNNGRVVTGLVSVNATSSLDGDGVVEASVTNGGTVRPGLSAGMLTVDGFSYTQSASGSLEIEIGGPLAGSEYDRLAITGTAVLDGALDVMLTGGYIPAAGSAFDVLTASSTSGAFSSVALPPLPADRVWDVGYSATNVRLDVIDHDVTYRVSQWDPDAGVYVNLGVIMPYETALSVVDWYGYGSPNGSQSNIPPGEGPELTDDESHVFLVASDVSGLHLAFVHDRSVLPLGGEGSGDAETEWTIAGDPNGAAWAVRDDPGSDVFTGAPGGTTFTADQAWNNFSDGGVIGPLDGASWAVQTRFTDVGPGMTMDGLSTWRAHSGVGAPISLTLEEDRPVRIQVVPLGPCPADFDGNGVVDVDDLLAIFAAWGGPGADANGDGTTDVSDLLVVLQAWGSC